MPGFRSHYFFGDMSLSDLSEAPEFILAHRTVYNLGEQGPDIFFYSPQAHALYPKNIGFLMHKEKVMSFFQNLLLTRESFGTKEDLEIADAYICGFMGHYTLDTVCHPYIHFRSDKKKYLNEFTKGFGLHVLLETDIDNDNVRHFLNCEPSDFNNWDTIKVSSREREVVSLLLENAITLTYPENAVKRRHIKSAVSFSRTLFHWMHDPHGSRKKLVMLVDKIFFHHIFLSSVISNDHLHAYDDPCNLEHNEYKNPWDPSIIIKESFYEMMEKAEGLYHNRIALFCEMRKAYEIDQPAEDAYYGTQNRLIEDLGDLSYDSGLPLPYFDPLI